MRRALGKKTVERLAKVYAVQLLNNSGKQFDSWLINAPRKKKLSAQCINEQIMPELLTLVENILVQNCYDPKTIRRVLDSKRYCHDGGNDAGSEAT